MAISGKSPGQILIRDAGPADAEAIVRAHYAAVHETASAFYPAEILDAWSRVPDEARYQQIREVITQEKEIVIVAEDGRKLCGFGVLSPHLREMRALYVHPRFGRTGIGGVLLRQLEARAIRHGITTLGLNASLNAEAFYRGHGYRALSRGTFRLASGIEMDCIKMEKDLPADGAGTNENP